MKKPQKPPAWSKIFTPASLKRLFKTDLVILPTEGGNYFHWDELRRRPTPPGISHEDWWVALKLSRRPRLKDVPLCDNAGQPFKFLIPDSVPAKLHEIDLRIGEYRCAGTDYQS